jgi:hypothetical protein
LLGCALDVLQPIPLPLRQTLCHRFSRVENPGLSVGQLRELRKDGVYRALTIKAHNLIDIKTKPRHPESNGIVERFNVTGQSRTLLRQ